MLHADLKSSTCSSTPSSGTPYAYPLPAPYAVSSIGLAIASYVVSGMVLGIASFAVSGMVLGPLLSRGIASYAMSDTAYAAPRPCPLVT